MLQKKANFWSKGNTLNEVLQKKVEDTVGRELHQQRTLTQTDKIYVTTVKKIMPNKDLQSAFR